LFRSAGLDLNFAGGVFSLNNTRTASAAAIPGWSFSRTDTNGTATALDLAGNVIQFPSRTNLLLRSQEFDNGAVWAASRATITANATTAPDGSVTAEKLVENSSTNTHRVYQAVSKAGSSIQYTASMFFKAAERTFAHLRMTDSIEDDRAGVGINLSTGEVGTPYVGGGSPFTSVSASSQALADGWYRLILTATTDTDTTVQVWAFTADGLTSASCSTVGNGVNGVFLWGAQLETGSTATAYIPTTTAAVTVVLPRITNRGILVEEARTNLMEQSGVPSAWAMTVSQNGLTGSVVGTGTENGVPYQEVRAVGTATSTFFDFGAFGSPARTAATSGQSFTGAFSAKIISGGASITAFQVSVVEETAGNVFFGQTVASFSLTNGVFSRVAATRTMGATAATCRLARAISFTNGAAVDVTIRFYLPQLEAGAFATSPIITTGAAGTRDMDFPVELLAADASAGFTLVTEGEYTLQQAANDTAVATVASADGAALVGAWRAPGGDAFFQVRTAGIGTAVSYGILARSGARIIRQATAVQAGNYRSAIDGTLGISTTTGTPTGLTRVNIGSAFSTGRPMNGYIRRVQVLPFAATDAQLQALTAP
jgi:hypothetical protein